MSIATLIRRMADAGYTDEAVVAEAIRAAEALERPARSSGPYVKRMSTKAKKVAFLSLCERDGKLCAQCKAGHRIIWRKQGTTLATDWDRKEEEPWTWPKFTIVNPTSNLEVDHKLALHLGGTNDLSNLWLLCRDCHKAKTSREQSSRLKRLFAA